MSSYNSGWIVEQLDRFIEATTGRYFGSPEDEHFGWALDGDQSEVQRQLPVVQRIFDIIQPGWNEPAITYDYELPTEIVWGEHRNLALQIREVVLREDEIRANLGEDAPEISAANLHPWVWSGARSLWQSGHYVQAVRDAATKLNAETQNKVGRRDVSETALFKQSFSLDGAKPGKARLRRLTPEDSDTYRSVQRGAMAFAEGVFAGIRNPLSHEADQEMSEQVALEHLAALSVLARWVDESTVEHAGEPS